MKAKLLLILLFVSSLHQVKAQCPTTDLNFNSQADITAFPTLYPSCTAVPDGINVEISGSDIVNLTPLLQLTSILGILEIRNCPVLTNLNGLDSLNIVGNDPLDGFILRDLPMLNTIAALSNLDSTVGEFTIRSCDVLTSLTGLESLRKIDGSLIVRDNGFLQNLGGIDSLQYIGETLELVGNLQLNDVSALASVDTIVGGIEGGVFIEDNSSLTNLTGLGHGSTEIGSNLDIVMNGNLTLCSVPSICKYLNDPPAGAIITVGLNALNCNSQAEILDSCSIVSGVEEIEIATTFVSPNPVIDRFKVSTSESGAFTLELVDVSGRKLDLPAGAALEFNIEHLAPGIYFLKMRVRHKPDVVIRISKI